MDEECDMPEIRYGLVPLDIIPYFPHFNDVNYIGWRSKFINILKMQSIWRIVCGQFNIPDNDEFNFQYWCTCDKVFSFLLPYLPDYVLTDIPPVLSLKGLWEFMELKFNPQFHPVIQSAQPAIVSVESACVSLPDGQSCESATGHASKPAPASIVVPVTESDESPVASSSRILESVDIQTLESVSNEAIMPPFDLLDAKSCESIVEHVFKSAPSPTVVSTIESDESFDDSSPIQIFESVSIEEIMLHVDLFDDQHYFTPTVVSSVESNQFPDDSSFIQTFESAPIETIVPLHDPSADIQPIDNFVEAIIPSANQFSIDIQSTDVIETIESSAVVFVQHGVYPAVESDTQPLPFYKFDSVNDQSCYSHDKLVTQPPRLICQPSDKPFMSAQEHWPRSNLDAFDTDRLSDLYPFESSHSIKVVSCVPPLISLLTSAPVAYMIYNLINCYIDLCYEYYKFNDDLMTYLLLWCDVT